MSLKIETTPTSRTQLGESPHWDPETKTLYYVDIFGASLHRYSPSTGAHTKVQLKARTSFIIPVEGEKDKFVISHGRDIVLISWEDGSDKITVLKTLATLDEISKKATLRFNDAKADAEGRLWFGTLASPGPGSPEKGAGGLFVLRETGIAPLIEGTTLSNRLTWNWDLKKFYFIDSTKGTIDQYDFDPTNGGLSNPEAVFTVAKHGLRGMPDGMTIDSEGNLWVALFLGKHVVRVDPRRPETLLEKVEVPAELVTCADFGGDGLDELYVTTAGIAYGGRNYDGVGDGVTYKVTGVGAKGRAPYKFKMLERDVGK